MADTPNPDQAYSGTPIVQPVPSNVVNAGLLSDTSSAPSCYVNQRFSAKLQAFMLSYVNMVNTVYGINAV